MQNPGTLAHPSGFDQDMSGPNQRSPRADPASGPPLVFLHANGYPPECYAPLLARLSGRYRTRAMPQRPLWPEARPEDLSDWHILSRDVLRFLDARGVDRTIAVGHSMGAIAALRAAMWAPYRFIALVLLEPVLLPRRVMLEWAIVRRLGLGKRLHPLISGAMQRTRTFESLDAAFRRYRPRPIFRYLSDDALRAYVAGITRQSADGRFELVYSPEWEARIYDTGLWNDWDLWKGIAKLRIPTLIMRGAESDTLRKSVTDEVRRRNSRIRIEVVARATHLLPLEQPEVVYESIESVIDEAAPGRQARAAERT